jgi:hypothetical protein
MGDIGRFSGIVQQVDKDNWELLFIETHKESPGGRFGKFIDGDRFNFIPCAGKQVNNFNIGRFPLAACPGRGPQKSLLFFKGSP